MKKSINIGLILFLLLQACASEENSSTQPVVEPIAEDTPINEPAEPNNPPPPENNNPPPENNNPPPENNNPPPPEGGTDIDRAIQIIEDADDEILDCIARALPTDIYQKIVNDLNPDNFEAGIVIGCFEDPSSSDVSTPRETFSVAPLEKGSAQKTQKE